MLRKPSFWVPLSIATGLTIVLAVMLDDPFGRDFAPFVQAMTTLYLVSVTATYVASTFQMAEDSRALRMLEESRVPSGEVRAMRNSARADAYAPTSVLLDIGEVALLARASQLALFIQTRSQRQEHLSGMHTYSSALSTLGPKVPKDILDAAKEVQQACMDVAGVAASVEQFVLMSIDSTGQIADDKFAALWQDYASTSHLELEEDPVELREIARRLHSSQSTLRHLTDEYLKSH